MALEPVKRALGALQAARPICLRLLGVGKALISRLNEERRWMPESIESNLPAFWQPFRLANGAESAC